MLVLRADRDLVMLSIGSAPFSATIVRARALVVWCICLRCTRKHCYTCSVKDICKTVRCLSEKSTALADMANLQWVREESAVDARVPLTGVFDASGRMIVPIFKQLRIDLPPSSQVRARRPGLVTTSPTSLQSGLLCAERHRNGHLGRKKRSKLARRPPDEPVSVEPHAEP